MKLIPVTTKYILSVYIVGLLFFTLFRCILIYVNFNEVHSIPGAAWILSRAMFLGFRFDTVVCGYVLILPAAILFATELTGVLRKWLFLSVHILVCLLLTACFLICAADIPFYSNYGNRLNVTILNWTDSPLFMIRMVWQDTTFLKYFVIFLLLSIVLFVIMARVYRTYKYRFAATLPKSTVRVHISKAVFALLFLGLMILCIRGRTDEKSPIVPGTAFFCNYNLPNQAGLNPVFTFMWSYAEGLNDRNKPLKLIDDNFAAAYVRRYLNVSNSDSSLIRQVSGVGVGHKYNVVLVIMESMTAYYLQNQGGSKGLTPNLDSLALHGYNFHDFYSAGIHTYNGIFSTLYGYPALMGRHSMEGTVIPPYTGMPYFFSQRGYETIYFTTHDDQFDNVGGFLQRNYVHTIVSKQDYPSEKIRSTLGISDHDLFDFSLPLLKGQYDQHKPFFAAYMTGSNHNPYIVPPGIPFAPKYMNIRGGCVEYADWSIGYFMEKASHMPWYDSTIFVFLGDHGTIDSSTFYSNMPFSYSHIPCIIYSPMFRNAPKDIHSPGGQIDVFPTIAGLLGGDYTNNTMGIDLLHNSRQYMFFTQDDKVGVADTSDLYIWQKDLPECILNIRSRKDGISDEKAKADSMRTYAFSMIQYTQWLRANNKTGIRTAK
jgi:phosphoglycerol transferase MdoB-like AlkP superfamily enzyme